MRLQSSENFLNTTIIISLRISTPKRITPEEIVWLMVDGMEVRVGVLAYLFDKWMAASIDGVGPTMCALLFVKMLCHACSASCPSPNKDDGFGH